MSVLYIARYNGGYLHFDENYIRLQFNVDPATYKDKPHPESDQAKAASVALFGKTGYSGSPDAEPVAGVTFEYFNSFYQPDFFPSRGKAVESDTKGFGWVAVVSDDMYKAMENALNAHGERLRQMYDIEVIALNNDHSDSKGTKSLYEHMSPTHWH